jgi:hypothetical protein
MQDGKGMALVNAYLVTYLSETLSGSTGFSQAEQDTYSMVNRRDDVPLILCEGQVFRGKFSIKN